MDDASFVLRSGDPAIVKACDEGRMMLESAKRKVLGS
jgi:hypothetical protein